VLAQIEPALYQAQLDQAVGQERQDEAQLANARIDLERYSGCASAATTRSSRYPEALVAQLEAQVKGDQAAIDNAQTTAQLHTITAPLAARTGIRRRRRSATCDAPRPDRHLMLTQVRPITILFTLPQQQLPR